MITDIAYYETYWDNFNKDLYLRVVEAKKQPMKALTFEEFKINFFSKILPQKSEHIRIGQCLINYLGEVWLEEYKRISSVHFYDETNIDCFYNDRLINNTLAHLEKQWKNYPL